MKKIIEKIKSLDKGTIFRTIMLVLGWINQIIALVGSTSFASHPAYQVISVVATIAVSAVTYWYNNDWTNGALLIRDIFDMYKDGKITKEELDELIKKHKTKEGK